MNHDLILLFIFRFSLFFFSFQNRTEQVRVSLWDFVLRIDWRYNLETTSCEMNSETCTFGKSIEKSCDTRNLTWLKLLITSLAARSRLGTINTLAVKYKQNKQSSRERQTDQETFFSISPQVCNISKEFFHQIGVLKSQTNKMQKNENRKKLVTIPIM